jgi:beta-N-acetylhexosaminidase
LSRRSFICGLSGPRLAAAEAKFLAKNRPAGIALFKRNVENPEQLARLIGDTRDAAGADGRLLILVDQEGGRVQRLSEPHWPKYPAARAFGEICRSDRGRGVSAARLCAQKMARDLHQVGINTTCAPVLDIPIHGAHNVIGNRAYAEDVDSVIELGKAVAEGVLASGVLPVIKHIPGHGRAKADSHFALPVVDTPLAELERTDFAPFRALRHLPMAMTAHVVFTLVDDAAPVTVSRRAIDTVIRGSVGFQGLLISDDLSMQALSGSLGERTSVSLAAGCDLALHCNGNLDEMEEVGSASRELNGAALSRFEAAFACLHAPVPFDAELAEATRIESLAALA